MGCEDNINNQLSIVDALKLGIDVTNVVLFTQDEINAVTTRFGIRICQSNLKPHRKSYFGIEKYSLEYQQ